LTATLVTGATTPMGRRLVELLLAHEADARVLAVGIEPRSDTGLPSDERLTYHRVDLRRARETHDLLFGPGRELSVHTVVHAPLHRNAADVGKNVHAINVESTRVLLLQAERHPTIRRFVFRSHSEVYRVRADQPSVFAEDHPVTFSPDSPQWLRDRVEADLMVCARMGMCDLQIAVLRCSECVGPAVGSQLYDYLDSTVCFRPMGFDPMLNVISVEDIARAVAAAVHSDAQGVFNIPGADTLPLSAVIALADRVDVPVPGPLLWPLYGLRALTRGSEFRYDLNLRRFHFSGVPEGTRASEILGYRPEHRVDWNDLVSG
jgi:UDP-glucose 4-epimerase